MAQRIFAFMIKAILLRHETGDQGTFGEIIVVDKHLCVTLELPWRNNAKGKSCVPAGTYIFRWRKDSPKHGACYEADPDDEAPNRTNVQIHSANLAGDVDKGYVSQLEGCIAPGMAIGTFKAGSSPAGKLDQSGVVGSKKANADLVSMFKMEPFKLEIQWESKKKGVT